MLSYVVWAIREIAPFVGARPADLAFVKNATYGTNAVLMSLARSWTPQDAVFTFSLGYDAVNKTVTEIVEWK